MGLSYTQTVVTVILIDNEFGLSASYKCFNWWHTYLV